MNSRLLVGAMLLAVSALPTAVVAGGLVCPAEFSGSGQATTYTASGAGACSLPVDVGFRVAINDVQYGNSEHCGECLRITGPAGTVVAMVADRCVGCSAGDLDLNPATWDVVADQAPGIVSINWERVPCPVSGNVQFKFEGSNPYYLKIQARDHRYGVDGMEYLDGSTWVSMARTIDNHFQATGVPEINDVTVRLTATSGQQIEANLGDPVQTGLIGSDRQFSVCQSDVYSDRFELIVP